jgi:hypothetical protein
VFVKNVNNFTFGVYWPHWPVCSISASRTWSIWPLWESDSAEVQQKCLSFKEIEAPFLLSCEPKFLPYFESKESSHARKHVRARSHTRTHTRTYVYEISTAILPSYSGLGLLIYFFPSVIRNIPYFPDHKAHVFPEKCDLNSTCVLCAEDKYYFQTYKCPYPHRVKTTMKMILVAVTTIFWVSMMNKLYYGC